MKTIRSAPAALDVLLTLTTAIGRAATIDEIYEAALDAIDQGLGVERASILLVDADGVMRFKAWRGLSDSYRRTTEGHTPWSPDTKDPVPVLVADVNNGSLDLIDVATAKIKLHAQQYPADKVRGSNAKYTEYKD